MVGTVGPGHSERGSSELEMIMAELAGVGGDG
jgi:hypothetical protein